MPIDRECLMGIFDALGQKLTKPTTICLIGSSPGIVSGQPDRQSSDIDVWRQRSAYDETELRRACQELGLLFDPKGELDPDAIYVQIVQPGVVKLPLDFQVEVLGRYGALTVAMPMPALLSAAKLVRGDPRDIEDVAWWVKERALNLDEIRAAVHSLPDLSQREAANENIVLVELVVADERRPEGPEPPATSMWKPSTRSCEDAWPRSRLHATGNSCVSSPALLNRTHRWLWRQRIRRCSRPGEPR